MNVYCDLNGDGTLEACELHECITMAENAWRDDNCPNYGDAFCLCPFDVISCDGAWGC